MPAANAVRSRGSTIATVLRVTSGNFLEMFDFFLFAFYATYIARAFFPVGSEFAGLMLTFMTFGAGFLMRPLGAVILGAYIDRIGRRKGLLVTLTIMATGTVLIACVPGYQTIGLLAPALVVLGRLLQGFSAGVELGGVSVYLSEIAPPGRKGLYVCWQSASQQVAIMTAAIIGYSLNSLLSPEQVGLWGWRIPFLIGCAIVPFLFYIRLSLEETEAFLHRAHHLTGPQVLASVAKNWSAMLLGAMVVVASSVSFYTIAVYMPTFGKTVLKLTSAESLIVTFCVGLSNFLWLPIIGALSDRIGRRPILVFFSGLTVLTSYPILAWLVAAPDFGNLLMVAMWLSFQYAGYNAVMVVALTEIAPPDGRTAGFSVAYALAVLFGGFTPLISTWLIDVLHNRAAPGLWMGVAGACGLVGALIAYRAEAVTARAAEETGSA